LIATARNVRNQFPKTIKIAEGQVMALDKLAMDKLAMDCILRVNDNSRMGL
jgi:hypothetical protein